MGYQTAPHGSLGLPCGLYQFTSLTEGTALLFESEWVLLVSGYRWPGLQMAFASAFKPKGYTTRPLLLQRDINRTPCGTRPFPTIILAYTVDCVCYTVRHSTATWLNPMEAWKL